MLAAVVKLRPIDVFDANESADHAEAPPETATAQVITAAIHAHAQPLQTWSTARKTTNTSRNM